MMTWCLRPLPVIIKTWTGRNISGFPRYTEIVHFIIALNKYPLEKSKLFICNRGWDTCWKQVSYPLLQMKSLFLLVCNQRLFLRYIYYSRWQRNNYPHIRRFHLWVLQWIRMQINKTNLLCVLKSNYFALGPRLLDNSGGAIDTMGHDDAHTDKLGYHFCGIIPIPESMLTYCWFDQLEQT